MPLPPFATVEDLEARLGVALDEHGPDYDRAAAALDDASALVRNAGIPWVDDHDELVDDMPDVVFSVTLAAALRAYQNPTGAERQTVGDVTVAYSSGGEGGGVYLTRAERAAIRKAAGTGSLVSVGLTSPYLGAESAMYIDDEQGIPFLFGYLPAEMV